MTLSRFETVTRRGINELWLAEHARKSYPTWLPRPLGPLSFEGIVTYVTNISTKPLLYIDTLFCFYYADLRPTNIMISEDGNLDTGIID
jgi:hypothetical protein